ncbi:MAG: hypothetical protein E6Q78_05530 [Rhodoferax sp.]|nr:MAG: hypothetical protein E6Q78_05530 [Rhodoferax sp.]
MKSPVLRTSQFQSTAFSPHGEVALWFEDQILYYDVTGPLNTEVIECLAVAQTEFLKRIEPQGPWGSIAVCKISAVMGPECLARYGAMMATPKPAGKTPVATAFVMGPDVDGYRLMAPLFAKIYAGIQRPFLTVETLEAGRQWVCAQIAQAQKAQT